MTVMIYMEGDEIACAIVVLSVAFATGVLLVGKVVFTCFFDWRSRYEKER